MLSHITEQSSGIFFWSRLPQDWESAFASRTSTQCNCFSLIGTRMRYGALRLRIESPLRSQPAVCAAWMTDVLSRVFSFSEKCALLTSPGWGSANGTAWSGSSASQRKTLMEICCIFTYLPHRSCDQDLTAACKLVSLSHTDAFPNR